MAYSGLFQLIVKIFKYGGVYNPKYSKIMIVQSTFIELTLWISTMCFFLAVKPIVIESNTEGFAEWCGTSFTITLMLIKLCLSKTEVFQKLYNKMLKDEENISDNPYENIRALHIRNTEKYVSTVKTYMYLIGSTVVIATIACPVFIYIDQKRLNCNDDGTCLKIFLLNYYYLPFDKEKYYATAVLIHNLVICCHACTYVVTEMIPLAPILEGILKLQHLQFVIENFDKYASLNAESEIEFHQKAYYIIKQSAIYHQKIIKDFEQLNHSMGTFILIDFLLKSFQLSSLLFTFMSTERGTMFRMLIALFVMLGLFGFFVFYWYSHNLTEEGLNVSKAISASCWYKADIATRRCMLLISLRSKRPLSLSVGSLYVVNMDLFLMIIRTIYTCLTVFSSLH